MRLILTAVISAALAFAQLPTIPSSGVGGATNLTTAGSVPYVSSSGVLSQDAGQFHWDATNNRLGIGTNAPTVMLDVAGSARFYDPTATTGVTQVSIRNGAGATSSNRPFRFQDNAGTTDLLWVDGSNTAPSIHGNLWYTLAEADPSVRLWNAGSLAWSSTVSSDSGTYDTFLRRDAAGVMCVATTSSGCLGTLRAALYSSTTNCSSSASPAVCSAAPTGSVVVAAAATTVTVNTTAVTANSQIVLQFDSSLGTKLGVTCNTTIPALYGVTARTAATSFQITATAPTTNPACFSYTIIN